VLPQSAHPAYYAAAATVGLHVRPIPLDADGRVSLGALVSALDEHVVLTVASAPSFTHGIADPIAWIAAATSARGVRLHVDATCGGWALAYSQREGRVGTAWSFTVYGVDSIALDLGPDRGGAPDLTALLYRDHRMHRAVRAASMSSGPLAVPAAWQPAHRVLADVALATRELGHEGCAELALEAVRTTTTIAQEINGIPGVPGIHVVAPPEATSFTLRTDATCDPFTLADALHRRGWSAQPVLVEVGPPLVRIPVTAAMGERLEAFWAALAGAVDDARARGRAQLDATLERLLERLDPHDVDEYATQLLLDTASVLDQTDHPDEDRRAQVNLLLATASPGVREAILSAYLDRLGRPMRAPQDTEATAATTAATDSKE